MSNATWWDIDARGRRWNAIFKQMNTEYWKAIKSNNDTMAQAYLERMLKIEKTIQPYVQEVTGLRRIINKHERALSFNPPVLTEQT